MPAVASRSFVIKLIDSPTEYNLPFPSWNPNQKEAAEGILNLGNKQVMIVESPTGTGKSGYPALVSYFRPGTSVLVKTRDLQNQYKDTMDIFETIDGRSHHPCVNEQVIFDFHSVYGERPSREDCPHHSPRKACEDFGRCPYEIQKAKCLHSRAKCLNYHYAFYARWWRPHANDLFCDEAHSLPVVLSDLIGVEMKDSKRKRLHLPQFPLAVGGAPYQIRETRKWIEECLRVLPAMRARKDIKIARSAKRTETELKTLLSVLSGGNAEWHIQSKPDVGFRARPVIPGVFSNVILIPEARSTVLMSATIGDPAVLASELGIEDYGFISYPHIFKKENRPIYLVKNAPKMSYRSPDSDYETQFDIIKAVLKKHEGERGIVHCMSWKHAEAIRDAIKGNGHPIMLPDGERIESVNKFYDSPPGTVAISPSWHEGLDLRDDRARFAVIAKVNYLSLADPVVRMRLKRKGGNAWYQWVAALGVVQSSGRIVRHLEDYGTTYIIDKNWTRCAKYAPKWYEWEEVSL